MKINGDKIDSKRLILRKLQADDYEDYCEMLMQREVSKWLGSGEDYTREDVKKTMEVFNRLWDKKGYGVWAVINKAEDKLIGHCGFFPIKDTDEIELLYAFSQKYWGHGYATEAAEAAIMYSREIYKWNSLAALAYNDNKSSISVLTKLGFKYVEDQEHFGVRLAYFNLSL